MVENEKQTNKEKLKDITDSIERGIEELFQSDKYAEYLRTMSHFHKYSVNNTMLIYMQKPDATLVAGFNKWRDQFERNVMKGEKGIKIIAPTPYKKKIEQEKRDPDTNLPMLDADGKVIIEEKEIKIPMFKPVTVFDVSQTDGKPLPQLASDLQGNVQNYEVFMEALRRSSPVPIDFKPIADNADGYFSLDKQKIAIREGMSEVQTVSAVVHEIAHSKLHNQKKIEEPKDAEKYQEVEIFDVPGLFFNGRIDPAAIPEGMYVYDLRGSDDDPGQPITVENHVTVNHAGSVITAKPLDLGEEGRLTFTEEEGLNFVGGEISAYRFFNEQRKDRNTEEVEAESISFAVCAYYGIATGENSFGYIATWSKDKELKELRASLETINSTSSELITDIDRHYADIMKEREAEMTVETAEVATETTPDVSEDENPTSDSNDVIDEIALKVQEETPVQAPDNGYMPDPSMSIEAMNAYGYMDSDMLPLSKERALELFERDVPIYMLYEGNTEAMAFDTEDIVLFSGCFGITREDWDAIKNEVPPMDADIIRQKREQAFLESPGDTYAIYQLKRDDATTDIRFMNSDYLKSKGFEPQYENYELIYTGALTKDGSQMDKLEDLYRVFNIEHPQDFTGHSLSISDIVALKQAGVVSYHYVDSVGYKELHNFHNTDNYLKNAEMQMEDDYGMIDGVINNAPKEPVKAPVPKKEETKSKKPSVLAKLRQYQTEDRQQTTQHRSAERDLI
ncbi:MAG TPA: YodL domain-containing protein [Thermotogota bacterium]|jgi:antirestriction protein ArdC|nr:YodL domain-containing protein [Thermotogota bacterium]HPL37967.1 YodL domain-containing protein [Thermotogota bacterium]